MYGISNMAYYLSIYTTRKQFLTRMKYTEHVLSKWFFIICLWTSKTLINLRLVILSDDDQHKQWLTSPETFSCCSYVLTCQFRILTMNLSTDSYFHTVSNCGKSTMFVKKQHPLEESNMADRAPKIVVNVCMHKFACTNLTPERRNGAQSLTRVPYCAWVINMKIEYFIFAASSFLKHGIIQIGYFIIKHTSVNCSSSWGQILNPFRAWVLHFLHQHVPDLYEALLWPT